MKTRRKSICPDPEEDQAEAEDFAEADSVEVALVAEALAAADTAVAASAVPEGLADRMLAGALVPILEAGITVRITAAAVLAV